MKKRLHLLCLFCAVWLLGSQSANAQGCVAIRSMGCGGSNPVAQSSLFGKGEWRAAVNYRYFRSYKHFRGDSEEQERVENGTEVINIAHSADLGLSYSLTSRLSFSVNLPVISYDRSSLYEHYGNSTTANPDQLRFHTDAKGIGDLRLAANYWLFDPNKPGTGNISLGLGVKLPTGNANVQDDFHKLTSEKIDTINRKAVDQSIQLGDGGWGFTFDIQAYQQLSHQLSLYFSGFYLFNPENVNETLTRGTLNNVDPLIAYHSIADQYAVRLGANLLVLPEQNLSVSLGARAEGIPSSDLIGKSEGFRRPGYVVSAEPGLFLSSGNFNFNLSVPVALYRNRVKSTYDLADPTGQRHGDAAFADYSINAGVMYRFGGHKNESMKTVPQFPNVTN